MKKSGKRVLALLLALVLAIAAAGCANSDETQPPRQDSPSNAQENPDSGTGPADVSSDTEPSQAPQSSESRPAETDGTEVLVVYFSRTGEQYSVGVIDQGNTAIVAEMIAGETGADLFEIVPADDHYPMTYDELTDVAKQEQNENARPQYAGQVPDLSRYRTVFIGAPVWWGDWPMILYTFFENNAQKLSGKTLIPFSTHEGSGLSGFDRKLSSVLPQSTVSDGLAVRGSDAQNSRESVQAAVREWIAGLDL